MSSRFYESHPIEELGLGTRGYNVLKRAGYRTIGQILDLTVQDILDLRNMGASSTGDLLSAIISVDMTARVEQLEQRVSRLEQDVSALQLGQ
jgi:DNA-directed RNA polymerase subunit alpha